MNRYRTFSLAIAVTLSTLAIPLRAANKLRAGRMEQTTVVWTNNDLKRLRAKGLISVVGQMPDETAAGTETPFPYVKTQDPEWYAEQAAKLRAQLESSDAELQHYRQVIEDARSLKTTTGGINLDEGDIGITPEAGIEILQQQVNEAQTELDALEDLAHRNGIPPGALRGQ
jgi:hypothetical protein